MEVAARQQANPYQGAKMNIFERMLAVEAARMKREMIPGEEEKPSRGVCAVASDNEKGGRTGADGTRGQESGRLAYVETSLDDLVYSDTGEGRDSARAGGQSRDRKPPRPASDN